MLPTGGGPTRPIFHLLALGIKGLRLALLAPNVRLHVAEEYRLINGGSNMSRGLGGGCSHSYDHLKQSEINEIYAHSKVCYTHKNIANFVHL